MRILNLGYVAVAALAACIVQLLIATAGATAASPNPMATATVKDDSAGRNVKLTYVSQNPGQKSPALPKAPDQAGNPSIPPATRTLCRNITLGTSAGTPPQKRFCQTLAALGTRSITTLTPTNLAAWARELTATLNLPDTTPRIGPNPGNNPWGMIPVGYPVWLWTEGPNTRVSTATSHGLTFRLTARRTHTSFILGDGQTLTCTKSTPYSSTTAPAAESPTCGHTYERVSPPTAPFTVTATAHWTITWTVAGLTGSFPLTYSASSQLAIGELQTLNR